MPLPELLSDTYTAARRQLIDPDRAALDLRPGDPYSGAALRLGQGPWSGASGSVAPCTWRWWTARAIMVAATPSGAWLAGSPVVEGLGFPLTTRIQVFTWSPTIPMRSHRASGHAPPSHLRWCGATANPLWPSAPWASTSKTSGPCNFSLNVVDFGMPLQEAIEAPKFSSRHFPSSIYPHTADPGLLRVEGRIPYEVQRSLTGEGP